MSSENSVQPGLRFADFEEIKLLPSKTLETRTLRVQRCVERSDKVIATYDDELPYRVWTVSIKPAIISPALRRRDDLGNLYGRYRNT